VRIVIVDSDLKAGRQLASSVEKLVPLADVLLYKSPDEAMTGIEDHDPDVAFIGPAVDGVDGPEFLQRAAATSDKPKYVGVVDEPDADASTRWVDAGATLVVGRPADQLAIRMALRHAGGGIDP
jgi:DNA-binding NarL/FixJ family response regulator